MRIIYINQGFYTGKGAGADYHVNRKKNILKRVTFLTKATLSMDKFQCSMSKFSSILFYLQKKIF
ncbi:hypothetical protein GCM10009120_34280 [Sphingobacterium siyangense subsp. cladoniae]